MEDTLDEVSVSYEIEERRRVYLVYRDSESLHHEGAAAIFFREGAAHAYKEQNDFSRVIELPFYMTDKCGWQLISTHNAQHASVLNILESHVRSKTDELGPVARILTDYDLGPDDFLDDERRRRIAECLFVQNGDIPDAWIDEVEKYKDEFNNHE